MGMSIFTSALTIALTKIMTVNELPLGLLTENTKEPHDRQTQICRANRFIEQSLAAEQQLII
jgi:hypothetical protein